MKFALVGFTLLILGLLFLKFISGDDLINKVFRRQTPTVIQHQTAQPQPQLANPASVNCSQKGGTLKSMKRGVGGVYSLCFFEDDMACEEWALFRGQCPVGGIKTTGYDTIDQMYCAWIGGQTLAVANSTCTLPDGSSCSTVALYNGQCSGT